MNKVLVSLLAAFIFLSACTNSSNVDVDKNTSGITLSDSLQNAVIEQVTEIHHNLELIRKTQGLIGSGALEVPNQRAQILEDISLINALLLDNQKKIEALTKTNQTLNAKNSALSKLITETLAQLKKQEEEVLQLKQNLALEEFKVTDLSIKMDEMQVENEKLQEEKLALETLNAAYDKNLNTVFITYGTEKELIEKGIAEKRAVIGGKRLGLSTAFSKNRSFFVEQDLRTVNEFPINGKNPRLLSLHPEGSYKLESTGAEYSKLVIIDADEFWSVSKFLVIQVN